ncbi:MAG TPA: hypothetical protein VIV60_06930 [Polyangiaceae bacterium]
MEPDCAQGTGSQASQASAQSGPDVEDCGEDPNAAQSAQSVRDAHARALALLESAIAATDAGGPAVSAAPTRHFKADDAKLLKRVRRTLESMRNAKDASYECEQGESLIDGLCKKRRHGVSLFNIHLCPFWWSYSSDKRALALLHEWAHKWGEGVNRVFEDYCFDTGYKSATTGERLKYPDAFAGYISEVVLGSTLDCWLSMP